MARPRFHRLPATQQDAIVDAALEEFAAHGFRDASLNRIIEAAGLSKGSMYYYFDGKEALYAHVIRLQLERLFEDSGPMPVPDTQDPDEFWATIEAHYLRLMRALVAAPHTAALLRGWLTAPASPALSGAAHDAEQAVMPWLMEAVSAGQAIGAVRTDVPTDLLLAVAMGIGQAADTWLITQPTDGDLPRNAHMVIGLIRRAIGA